MGFYPRGDMKQEKIRKKGVTVGAICWLAIVLLIPVVAKGELSDAQKLETVYKMYADYKKDFPSVKDIAPREAMVWKEKEDIVFVDTRKPAEMKVSMLPNAISQKDFLDNKDKYKDKSIVAYCTISYRSGLFAAELEKEGIEIYNLKGGILAWVLEGGKVYDNDKETHRVHVYGEKWNYLPKGYEAVLFGWFERMGG